MIAKYLRVSTSRQDTENQRAAVHALIRAKGGKPGEARSYTETVQGDARHRPAYSQLLKDVRERRVTAVFTWALDRLGRNTAEIVAFVRLCDSWGVPVYSTQESWLDLSPTSPVRELLLYVFAWVAAQEKRRLSERTKAGLAVARARLKQEGRKLGRPPGSKDAKKRRRRFRVKPAYVL